MSEDHDDGADLEWIPPSVAEQKVIDARRERSNKISKLMGDYLLKGYKMLATTCPICGTIELEDKQGRKYCIACSEVDCEENSKDDPAVNPIAAQNAIAEEVERQIIEPQPIQEEIVTERRVSQRNANPSLFSSYSSNDRPSVRPLSTYSRTSNSGAVLRNSQTLTSSDQPVPLIHSSLDTVFAKLNSATEALANSQDIEISRQLVGLIKECADCVQSLKSAADTLQ